MYFTHTSRISSTGDFPRRGFDEFFTFLAAAAMQYFRVQKYSLCKIRSALSRHPTSVGESFLSESVDGILRVQHICDLYTCFLGE